VKPFRFSDPATTELAHAIRWYEQQRAGLGGELFDAIAETINLIRTHPEIGLPRPTRRPSRQLRVNRFPYKRRLPDSGQRYLRRGGCAHESAPRLLEESFLIPLGLELGVEKVRGPGTLEPRALPELALLPEAKALEKALRRKVARICPGDHSMHRELTKRVVHDRPNRLRRIAVTLLCRSQREANLGLPAVGPRSTKADVSYESA
jgi:hypothetical protein